MRVEMRLIGFMLVGPLGNQLGCERCKFLQTSATSDQRFHQDRTVDACPRLHHNHMLEAISQLLMKVRRCAGIWDVLRDAGGWARRRQASDERQGTKSRWAVASGQGVTRVVLHLC